jgi:hypothetical protein
MVLLLPQINLGTDIVHFDIVGKLPNPHTPSVGSGFVFKNYAHEVDVNHVHAAANYDRLFIDIFSVCLDQLLMKTLLLWRNSWPDIIDR